MRRWVMRGEGESTPLLHTHSTLHRNPPRRLRPAPGRGGQLLESVLMPGRSPAAHTSAQRAPLRLSQCPQSLLSLTQILRVKSPPSLLEHGEGRSSFVSFTSSPISPPAPRSEGKPKRSPPGPLGPTPGLSLPYSLQWAKTGRTCPHGPPSGLHRDPPAPPGHAALGLGPRALISAAPRTPPPPPPSSPLLLPGRSSSRRRRRRRLSSAR